jgi:hypothetical protein
MPRRRRARSIRTRLGERADNRTKREKAREARERGLTIAQLWDLASPRQILAALTTHEVAFTLADTYAAIMNRVRDKVTRGDARGGNGPGRSAAASGAGEEAYTTLSVIDAPGCSKG